jgi:hypothetical protein
VGVVERRTGMWGLGAQSAFSGRNRGEDGQRAAAEDLRPLAEAQAPQAPRCRTTLAYTRLTAKAALEALRAQGYGVDQWPSPSTMAEVLNRLGYCWRKVVKAQPQKKIAETDAIVATIAKKTNKRGHRHGSNG